MISARFLKSAVLPEDYPAVAKPEVALIGRSNSGKSSLLNAMYGGKKLAKTSGTPGKTRLLNFFDVGENYRIVDLPGYGYAARDLTERQQWATMIETYIFTRVNLKGILLICDVRRSWSQDEQAIVELAKERGLEVICALTKIDKLSRNDYQKKMREWVRLSKQKVDFFWPVSSLSKTGVQDIESFIFKTWVAKEKGSKAK